MRQIDLTAEGVAILMYPIWRPSNYYHRLKWIIKYGHYKGDIIAREGVDVG